MITLRTVYCASTRPTIEDPGQCTQLTIDTHMQFVNHSFVAQLYKNALTHFRTVIKVLSKQIVIGTLILLLRPLSEKRNVKKENKKVNTTVSVEFGVGTGK